jgi:glycosyltransferase involved in cell wall biosynthesis
MNEHPRILHVISRLDGYGGARMLRYVVAQQVSAGQNVTVAALTAADDGIADELRAAGAAVHVLASRWKFDPIAVVRFARLRRRMPAAVIRTWDDVANLYVRLTGQPASITAPISPAVPLAGSVQRDRASVLAELGLPADARLIALAGPLIRQKQIDEAIWCYELVRVIHPQARLIVFGGGPDRARLERYAELVSEPGCVRFPGYRGDLLELLPSVDVFWQLTPSRATPHALLEAMAAGVPVVASDVPAHRAVIASDATGLLVPLGHRAAAGRATDRLLNDAALAAGIGQAARGEIARKWSLADRLARESAAR